MKKITILAAALLITTSVPALALGLNAGTSSKTGVSVGSVKAGTDLDVGVRGSSRDYDPSATTRSSMRSEAEIDSNKSDDDEYQKTKKRRDAERAEAERMKRRNDMHDGTKASTETNADANVDADLDANVTTDTDAGVNTRARTGIRANVYGAYNN